MRGDGAAGVAHSLQHGRSDHPLKRSHAITTSAYVFNCVGTRESMLVRIIWRVGHEQHNLYFYIFPLYNVALLYGGPRQGCLIWAQ
eukprot:3367707-Pyramimonas_sp.AAC.1